MMGLHRWTAIGLLSAVLAGNSQTVTPASLLALTRTCKQISTGMYSTDDGTAANIPVCSLTGAVFWTADMDIDCDGISTAHCNLTADPWYQAQTSAQTSTGQWMNAETMPYFVIPLASTRFNFSNHQIQLGTVAAILYNNRLEYAVFADEGPANIIGEASYATAALLGINSNPATGGTDGPVSYIVFTGATGRVLKNEDHNEVIQVGSARALQLLQDNATALRPQSPAHSYFQVSLPRISIQHPGPHSIEIRNACGQRILKFEGYGETEYHPRLQPGVYWVKITIAGVEKTLRAVAF